MIFFGAPDEMTPEAQAYLAAEMARQIQEYVNGAEWGTDLSVGVDASALAEPWWDTLDPSFDPITL